MPLKSKTFAGDRRLEACLVDDVSHLTPGVKGAFVARVQAALIFVDGADIDERELVDHTYGTSTAAAVLSFKTARKIINRSYQQQPDNIVGKMTIKALDDELFVAEKIRDVIPPAVICPGNV
jgi:hypothetical protein